MSYLNIWLAELAPVLNNTVTHETGQVWSVMHIASSVISPTKSSDCHSQGFLPSQIHFSCPVVPPLLAGIALGSVHWTVTALHVELVPESTSRAPFLLMHSSKSTHEVVVAVQLVSSIQTSSGSKCICRIYSFCQFSLRLAMQKKLLWKVHCPLCHFPSGATLAQL